MLSHRTLNKFVHAIGGFFPNKLYHQDTDSQYVHRDLYENLKEAVYVGNKLGQRKTDYSDVGIFYGLFLAPKMKLFYTIDKYASLMETNIEKN